MSMFEKIWVAIGNEVMNAGVEIVEDVRAGLATENLGKSSRMFAVELRNLVRLEIGYRGDIRLHQSQSR